MKVSKDKVVQIHYTLTDSNGIQLDSSEGKEPLEYIQGNNMLISGLEAKIEGTEAGEKFTVTIPAKEAYGEYDDRLLLEVPRKQFDYDGDIEIGMPFQAMSPNGGMMIVHVVNVTDENVTVDGNHELAGKDLTFDVEIVSVRDATQEELDALVNGCGCGCGCEGDCSDGNCGCDGGCC